MPSPTQATAAAALRRHLVRPRRIASSMHRPVLATASAAAAGVAGGGTMLADGGAAEALVSFGRTPAATAAAAAAAAAACRRPIFSLAAAALGLNKPSSTSSSSLSSTSSPSSSAATTTSTSQAPNGGSYNTISTVRTLPYAVPDLFRIIADVDAYASFLPHCTASRVTQWRNEPSSPSSSWPARADLTVGWGPLSQAYSSRVYCAPRHGVVEAVSGRAGVPTLTAAERAEMGLAQEEESTGPAERAGRGGGDDDPFESLVTRWEIVPAGSTNPAGPAAAADSTLTRVELRIRFQFRNPLYQLAAAQVGSEMATTMIEAFEKRAATLLGPSSQIRR